jgi:hypothetical protein
MTGVARLAPSALPAQVRAGAVHGFWLALVALPALIGLSFPARAAVDETPPRIYSCVDSQGRRLSSDRPIPECLRQEQRLLNRDGSQRATVPPLLSPQERARQDQLIQQRAQEQAAAQDQARRDRILLQRYPDAASHDAARARGLAPTQELINKTRNRLADLAGEADRLTTERAKLGFKPVPPELASRVGINEATTDAQRNILQNLESERDRLNDQFDQERERLRQLWSNAAAAPASAASPSKH